MPAPRATPISAVVEHHGGLSLRRPQAGVVLLQVGEILNARAVIEETVGLCPELLVPPAPGPHGKGEIVPYSPILQQLRGCSTQP